MYPNKETLIKRTVQAVAAAALLPLLAFCGGGEMAAPAAVATPLAEVTAEAGGEGRTHGDRAVPADAAAPGEPAAVGAAAIWINEVLAHTDEPQVDSLELYNPGTAPVNLAGWCISDDKDTRDKYCFPATVAGAPPIIAAGGYFLITAPELGFAFSEFGEDLFLSAQEGDGLQLVDQVAFGVSPNGVSLGRYLPSTGAVHFPLQREYTPGRTNAGPLIPPVVISEIAYDPKPGPEYLVLTNSSDQVAPLYDLNVPANSWRVQGIGNNSKAYTLPPQTALSPGESIVLTADPAAFAAAYPQVQARVFGPFEGKLNNDGERIVLEAPQPPEANGDVAFAEMDVVNYGVVAPWPAAGASGQALVRKDLHAYGDDPRNWRAGTPGMGARTQLMLPLVRR
jgi:hypothetical protein